MSLSHVACALVVVYVSIVRSLRWRRYNAVHAKFAGRTLESITPDEAQEIVHLSIMWDIPSLNLYALSFAMFKTYAIPRVSVMLGNTKELKCKELVSKRQADTEILIGTMMACPINGRYVASSEYYEKNPEAARDVDPRAMVALARMNWLHSRYAIRNEDYLYTLGLFIFETAAWADKWGWRPMSELERHALFLYWSEVGERMGIKDIPATADQLRAWCLEHEEREMKPAISNRDLAGYTTNELLSTVPEALGLKNFGRRIIICLLEERVRVAMIQPAQPRAMHIFVEAVMQCFRFTQGWLSLPRRKPWCLVPFAGVEEKPVKVASKGGEKPRMHPTKFQARPWYKPVPSSPVLRLFDWLAIRVGYINELPNKELKCDGYRLEEIGPTYVENTAHEEVFRNAEELLGCPIAGPWSIDGGLGDAKKI